MNILTLDLWSIITLFAVYVLAAIFFGIAYITYMREIHWREDYWSGKLTDLQLLEALFLIAVWPIGVVALLVDIIRRSLHND